LFNAVDQDGDIATFRPLIAAANNLIAKNSATGLIGRSR
jgi:hypothetical protein